MAEFPSMPVWTDALLGDTAHLDTEQFGAYCLMLFVAWRSPDNSLPDDDAKLANITRLSMSKWRRSRETLRSFWGVHEGRLRQKNLDKVKNSLKEKQKQKVSAGQASALKRKETTSTYVEVSLQRKGNGEPTNQNQNQNQDIKSPSSVPTAAKKNVDVKDFGGMGIERLLDDQDLEKIRVRAPGWDKHFLFRTYDDHARQMGKPDDPKGAFYGWLKKFTKGKPPA